MNDQQVTTTTTVEATPATGAGLPNPETSYVKSKASRPFAIGMESYTKVLDRAILDAMKRLTSNEDKTRYERVILRLFAKVLVEVPQANGDPKIFTYPLHKFHYGPIDKFIVKQLIFPEDATDDYVQAMKFCYRDPSIWLEVNAEGKNPGGDGTGFGDTACSPFRDAQIRLRDQGYYLVDLSQYIFDADKEKWYFKIDIRLYQDLASVDAVSGLWHKYGVIPGLGPLIQAQADAEAAEAGEATDPTDGNYSDSDEVDHGDLDVEKVVPSE